MSKTVLGTKLCFLVVLSTSVAWAQPKKKEIVHDAEYNILLEQHRERWSAEDKELDARLEALRRKHGKRPNIIHIMWDDMSYGAIGHKMLNDVSGYSSPTINKLAAKGMTFTRMYSEPSCQC